MPKTDPIRYANGVTVYPPKPDARRQQHRVVYRDTDGVRQSLWRTHREDAHTTALEVAAKLDRANMQSRGDHGHRTVAELVDAYQQHHADRWAPNTRDQAVRTIANHVIPAFGHRRCDTLDADELQAFLDRATANVEGIHRALRAAITYGVHRGWLPQGDVMAGVTAPDGATSGTRPVDESKVPPQWRVEALAEAAGDDHLQPRLAAYCGVRRGELFALGCDDIDFDAGLIRIERQLLVARGGRHLHLPKYRRRRYTFIPGFLHEPLRRHVERMREVDARPDHPCRPCKDAVAMSGGPLLFTSPSGRWINRPHWQRTRLARWRHDAGWDGPDGALWTWHDLRHHFCTWALAKPGEPYSSSLGAVPSGLGLEVADVSLFAGHATPDLTWRVYVSPREGAIERAREASRA